MHLGISHLPLFEGVTRVCFDTETTGLQPEPGGLRLLQLASAGVGPVVIDLWELSKDEWQLLRAFFAVKRTWVAHNAAFDLGWLQQYGVHPEGDIVCTMLVSRLLSNGFPNVRHGLALVVERYLHVEMSKEEQRSDWSVPELRPEQVEYAAKDAALLVNLDAVLQQRVAAAALGDAVSLECSALAPITQMNRTGLPFNRKKLEALEHEYVQEIDRMGEEFVVSLDAALPRDEKLPRDPDGSFNLRAKASGNVRAGTKVLAGFNLNSPKQLVDKLTTLLGTAPLDPKTLKPSASRQALRGYAADHKVVQVYLAWKRAEKRRQMVRALLDHQSFDGFVRASYVQLGADTGRFSCRNPNNQQIPRDKGFRQAAEAPQGWSFVVADFGQMELRLAAALSMDERMIKAFQDGEDLHTITAAAIYPDKTDDPAELKARRQVAKSANFGLLFGSGAKGLRDYAGATGITLSLEDAEVIRDTFHKTYQGIHTWQRDCADVADKSKNDKWACVRIPVSNLRRYMPGDMNRLTTRCNTPVQGSGAAITKLALATLWPKVREAGEDKVRISGCIHDEIILLVREGLEEEWAKRLSNAMESAEALWLGDIPPLAEAAWGKTWYDAK
jgi:DNA polymerase I-like protein with 3'-5' exonuclease and polymerase domains